MTGINWNLAAGNGAMYGFQNALATGLAMGEGLRKRREQRDTRKAIDAYLRNPEDQEAHSIIMQNAPEIGMKLGDNMDQRAFNRAVGEYLAPGGQPNALLGVGMPGPVSGYAGGTWNTDGSPATPDQNGRMAALPGSGGAAPGNALANALTPMPPARPGAGFDEAFAPMNQPQPASMPEMQTPQDQAAQPDLSVLGQPETPRDRAFLAMFKRNPLKALEIQSKLRDNFIDRIKDEREFYGLAVQELSSMADEAGWQRALQRLAPMTQALGTDLLSVVPPTYPGPEVVQQLMERALPIKEQLDLFLREANIEADNERADRNTDSLIETREGRLSEYQRANRAREGNQRRGQDMTDKRVRSGAGRGGDRLPEVSSPAEAMKLPSGTKFRIKGTNQVKVRP